jgi:sulfite dehydrogenase
MPQGRWLAAALALAAGAAGAQPDDEGRRLFTSVTPACALCHSLKDAGADGAIGPSLDELKPDEDRVVQAMRNGIGQMPAFAHLREEELRAIARYVARVTR